MRMNLHLNAYLHASLQANYKSEAQKIRVLTETWLQENAYCPGCGHQPIGKFANNRPVADFFCPHCHEEYELKSGNRETVASSVADGAYHTMIKRILSDANPNFLFMAYRKSDYSVRQLMLVPKHFITPAMITPRRKGIAGRPGYIMCSMNISALPASGKIMLIDKAKAIEPENVLKKWQAHLFLRGQKMLRKGWLLAIMKCLDELPNTFTLTQMYAFENRLKMQFPQNRHIREKIRQQLQILRDQGLLAISGNGHYAKPN